MDAEMFNSVSLDDLNVVYGHRNCQSGEVRWLCLKDIYQKFHRANTYDIGGTYIKNVPDHWFSMKTEQVGDIFLLHLFAGNRHEGRYSVALSNGGSLRLDKKSDLAYLPESLQYYTYTIKDNKCQAYITTYSFSDLDVEFLKGRQLHVSLRLDIQGNHSNMFDSIKMEHDCGALLMDPIGADFVVESEEGVKFNVHKIILSTHSDVFKAMLKDDTAESQNNIVRLIDVGTEDVRVMLEFIYTGTIADIDNVNFANIMMLADRYNLAGLRELCNHALARQLTTENALDILILADLYDSDSLKLDTLKYIKKNRDCLKSSAFKEISNMALVREICAYLAE